MQAGGRERAAANGAVAAIPGPSPSSAWNGGCEALLYQELTSEAASIIERK